MNSHITILLSSLAGFLCATSTFLIYKLYNRKKIPVWSNRNRPIAHSDINLLEAIIANLNENNWMKNDDRICIPGGSQSLFCTIAFMSKSLSGHYDHRGVVTQEIRFTIEDFYENRWQKHPIKDFNNHDDTTIEDVHLVLSLTLKRCKLRLDALKQSAP